MNFVYSSISFIVTDICISYNSRGHWVYPCHPSLINRPFCLTLSLRGSGGLYPGYEQGRRCGPDKTGEGRTVLLVDEGGGG